MFQVILYYKFKCVLCKTKVKVSFNLLFKYVLINLNCLTETVDITMNDMRMNGGSSLAETDPPGSGFKRFFLGIYLVIIIGLVFGLIFCISLPFINQREEI